jgi:hypothetical protein
MLLLTTNARQIDPYPRAPSILFRLWLFLSCFRVNVLLTTGFAKKSALAPPLSPNQDRHGCHIEPGTGIRSR